MKALLLLPILLQCARAQGNSILQTSASCDETFIYFRINFARPFRGIIYTEDAFPQCVYVNGTAVPQVAYIYTIVQPETRQLPHRSHTTCVYR